MASTHPRARPLRCKVEGISVLSAAAVWRRHPPDPRCDTPKLRTHHIPTHTFLHLQKPSTLTPQRSRRCNQNTATLRNLTCRLIGVTDTIYKRWDVGIGGKRERVLQTSRGNKVSPILLCRPPLIADNVVLRGNFVNGTFFVVFYYTSIMIILPGELWSLKEFSTYNSFIFWNMVSAISEQFQRSLLFSVLE